MPGTCVPYEQVAKSDVFVLPSLREGLPTALLEAMVLKTPAVASRIGGVPEVIEDGKNGLLVQPGDWQGIADRVIDLLNHRSKRELFAANGRKVVEERFDVKKNVKELEGVFLDFTTS